MKTRIAGYITFSVLRIVLLCQPQIGRSGLPSDAVEVPQVPFRDAETGNWGFREQQGSISIPAVYSSVDDSWNGGFSWAEFGSCRAEDHPGWRCARENLADPFGTFLRPDGTPLFSFHAHPVADVGDDVWLFVPPRFEHGLAFVRFPDGLIRGITTNGLPLPLHERYGGFASIDAPHCGESPYVHYRGDWALVGLPDGRAGVLGPDHEFAVWPSEDVAEVHSLWKDGLTRLDPFQFEGADRVPWLQREMVFAEPESMTLERFVRRLRKFLDNAARIESGPLGESEEVFQRRRASFIDVSYPWELGQKPVNVPAGSHTVRSLIALVAEQTHSVPLLDRQWIQFIPIPQATGKEVEFPDRSVRFRDFVGWLNDAFACHPCYGMERPLVFLGTGDDGAASQTALTNLVSMPAALCDHTPRNAQELAAIISFMSERNGFSTWDDGRLFVLNPAVPGGRFVVEPGVRDEMVSWLHSGLNTDFLHGARMSDFRDLILDSLQESGRMTNASVRLDSAVSELSLTLPHPLPSNWLDLLTVVTKVLPVDVNVSSNGVSFLPAAPGAEARMPNSDDRPPPFSFSAWGENGAGDSVRVKCHLSNLTPDDWFVAVDENGRIAPLWLPTNGEDAKVDDAPLAPVFDILEELPQDVRWVAWLHPTYFDGRNHTGEEWLIAPDFIMWNVDRSQVEQSRGICPVRALNGKRWIHLGGSEERATGNRSEEFEGLRWSCELEGTNLILTVENEGDGPRLLGVWPDAWKSLNNDLAKKYSSNARSRDVFSGPFPLEASLSSPHCGSIFRWPPTAALQGLFLVLHGKGADSASRAHSFKLNVSSYKHPCQPGDRFQCDVRMWLTVVCPRTEVFPSCNGDEKAERGIYRRAIRCHLKTLFIIDEDGRAVTESSMQEIDR